jgi:hypothetical protein
MEEIFPFLKEPWVQTLGWSLGVLGWIVGVAAGWLQFRGYREQKAMETAYRSVLEQAQIDWKGKYTEQQVEDLTKQFRHLENQIRLEVPQLARQTFLRDQRASIANSIAEMYEQYTDLEMGLSKAPETDALAPSIKMSIERKIRPAHRKQQRQQRLIYVLLGVLAILTTVLTFFPFIADLISERLYFWTTTGVSVIVGTDSFSAEYLLIDFSMYFAGLMIIMFVVFSVPIPLLRDLVLRNRPIFTYAGIAALLAYVVLVYEVVREPLPLGRNFEIVGAIVSLLWLGLTVRILHLVYSER